MEWMSNERFEILLDDESLVGIFHKGKRYEDRCIVASHGLGASKDSPKYVELAKRCEEMEVSLVRFDFRGLGESDGSFIESVVSKRISDLDAVVDRIGMELGIERIGLFGSSLGAYLSLLKAGRDQRVETVVSVASPFDFVGLVERRSKIGGSKDPKIDEIANVFLADLRSLHLDMSEVLRDIGAPTLVVHGDVDEVVPPDHAMKIHGKLDCEKKLTMIRGGDHVFSNPVHLESVISETMEWFSRYLLK